MPPHTAVFAFQIVCHKTAWDGTRTFLSEGYASLAAAVEALDAHQHGAWDSVRLMPMSKTSGRRGLCVGGIRLSPRTGEKESP